MKCLYRNPFIRSFIFQDKEPAGSGPSGGSERDRQMQNNVERYLSFGSYSGTTSPFTLELNRLDRLSDEMSYDEAKDLIEDLAKNNRISSELAQDYRDRLGEHTNSASTYFLDLRDINVVYSFLDNASMWPGGISPIGSEREREMKESMRQNAGVAHVFLDDIHRLRAQGLPGNPYQQN